MPARVPLVEPDGDDEIVKAIIRRRESDGARLNAPAGWMGTLDRILLHSPLLAEGWNAFYGAIRSSTTVPPRLRELIILRIAHLNGDRHNWWHHEMIARGAGITQEEIDGLPDWQNAGSFSPLEQAVLAYTDSLTTEVKADDKVFTSVSDRVTTRQMVEITAIVASYNCVSRFLVGMDIDSEP
jgi:AhpD family alkylhydroperoxidase